MSPHSLFPAIQPAAGYEETPLPLCREIAWDFEKNIPIFQDGQPLEVTGLREGVDLEGSAHGRYQNGCVHLGLWK